VCYNPANHWNALTDGRFKYIYHARDAEEQLFDLRADPGETQDLASVAEHAATVRIWRERMVQHLAERGEPFVKGGRLLPRPEPYLYSPSYPGCSCHPLRK
jgi:arylsulfatase